MENLLTTYLATLAGFAALVLLLTGYVTKSFKDKTVFWGVSLKQLISIGVAEAVAFGAYYTGTASVFSEISLVMVALTAFVSASIANGWVTYEFAQEVLVLLKARLGKK